MLFTGAGVYRHHDNGGKKNNDSDDDSDDSDDSDASDDSDTSDDSDVSESKNNNRKNRGNDNGADAAGNATGSARRTRGSANPLADCCSACGRTAVDVAAKVVAACGGDLRKEPPHWLSDALDGGGARGPPKLKYPVSQPVVLGMQVYGTDTLVQDPYVSSPVIKVHCLNTLTGEYVTKADVDTSGGAASYYERQTNVKRSGRDVVRTSSVCDRVLPLLTPPCRLGSRGVYGERLEWDDHTGGSSGTSPTKLSCSVTSSSSLRCSTSCPKVHPSRPSSRATGGIESRGASCAPLGPRTAPTSV